MARATRGARRLARAAWLEITMADKDLTPYQEKVVRRYYDNLDTLSRQRLAELVSDLYLADEKKKSALWKKAAAAMQKAGVPQDRIDHLVKMQRPDLLAQLVKELERGGAAR